MKVPNSIFTLLLAISLGAGCIAAPSQASDESGYLLLAQAQGARESAEPSDNEELKMAALEGLMSASPERALPLVKKVLEGNHSEAVKSRALFVLSQIGTPEADGILVAMANDASQTLRHDAIRMIGIAGNRDSVAQLGNIYRNGDSDVKESVLNAYLIADDSDAVYELARDATNEDEFNAAVQILAAMGASDKLRLLVDKGGDFEVLIQAYAIAGDLDSLQKIVAQASDAGKRSDAISAIGIIGGSEGDAALMSIYRGATDEDTKEAALQGLLISGYDKGILELFRKTQDPVEKRQLLRTLMHMDSDLVIEIIDETLEGN